MEITEAINGILMGLFGVAVLLSFALVFVPQEG